MLEGIVGPGKAIVRVNADIDFDRITLNEEEYDPAAPVVRSTRDVVESTESNEGGEESAEELINKRRGVIPPSAGSQEKRTKRDVTTNYEINKISRTIFTHQGIYTDLKRKNKDINNFEAYQKQLEFRFLEDNPGELA